MASSRAEQILERLGAELGRDRVRSASAPLDEVDGVLPAAVVRPASVEAAAATIAACARAGLALVPTGAGSRRALGAPPARADVLLELGTLDAVSEYEVRDQYVVLGAGARLDAIEARLGADGLTIASDFPVPGPGTVGGAIACGVAGWERLAPRGPRHALIGVRVAHPDGAVTRHGARVHKNVAGLDVARLHIGALGTLGVVVEATLRLRAVPPAERFVAARYAAPGAAIEAALAIVAAGLCPEVAYLSGAFGAGAPFELVLRFRGEQAAVRWQAAAVRGHLVGGGAVDLRDGDAAAGHFAALARPWCWPPAAQAAVLELRTLPSELARTLADVERAAAGVVDIAVGAHAASGLATLVLTEGGTAPARATLGALVAAARARAGARGGRVRILSAPAGSKAGLDVWVGGEPGAGFELMRRLKAAFDPAGVLNPGRYVGGL